MYLFRNKVSFYGEEGTLPTTKLDDRSLSASVTTYSIYSQLPSTLEVIPPSTKWGPAMLWWQGPIFHGGFNFYSSKSFIISIPI